LSQVVTAVSEAHSIGVVHRDIKPNNIVISEDEATVYLIDFGICQYIEGNLTKLTLVDEPFGNPAFAAPECFLGTNIEPGPTSDVYSLGKLIYWMISGKRHIAREDISDGAVRRILYKGDITFFLLG
jgi:serine/threonine protein kinase